MYWSLEKGFQRKKGNDFETFYIGNFAFNDQVNCILDLDKETFLIGTSHTGLLLIKNNRVYHLTPNNETASKNIHSIIIDTKQNYWITTENSIESFQLQGTNILSHRIYNESFGSYILDAGNVNLDKDGYPYWSNGEYKVVYDPSFATSSVKSPLISFKDILINSAKLLDNDQISVLPDQKIEINYKTIYWGRENNLQLTYLLISNPGDTTERSVQNNGKIILTDILPGHYRVLLKATDTNDIYYSSAINITVREFWYNTWTFRIVMGVLIISGIVLYFRQKAKSQLRLNEQLEVKVKEQTQEIEKEKNALIKSYKTIDQQNKEKDVLIDEINHRVKNNLQFISAMVEMQMNNQLSKDAIQALLGTSRRIKAMSLVHELLYNKKEEEGLSMKAYIHELTDNLKEMALDESHQVQIDIFVEDLLMDSKTSLSLGMIISELVSNSFKHAFEGIEDPEVKIQLTKDAAKGVITLSVSDNGNGYQTKPTNKGGLGSRLVDIFSRQLEGEYIIESKDHFSYVLQFKTIES
jgi:two-component sensor histidine kinase